MNPLWILLAANTFIFLWGVRVWQKGLMERWMGQLSDVGSELLGYARRVKLLDPNEEEVSEAKRIALAEFDRCTEKLLFLFDENSDTYNQFKRAIEALRNERSRGYLLRLLIL